MLSVSGHTMKNRPAIWVRNCIYVGTDLGELGSWRVGNRNGQHKTQWLRPSCHLGWWHSVEHCVCLSGRVNFGTQLSRSLDSKLALVKGLCVCLCALLWSTGGPRWETVVCIKVANNGRGQRPNTQTLSIGHTNRHSNLVTLLGTRTNTHMPKHLHSRQYT